MATQNLNRKNITFTPDEWENFIADVNKQTGGKIIIDFESAAKKARQEKIEATLKEYAEEFDKRIKDPRNIENGKNKEGKIIIKKSKYLETMRRAFNDPGNEYAQALLNGDFSRGSSTNYDVDEYIRESRGYSDKTLDEIFNTKVTVEEKNEKH